MSASGIKKERMRQQERDRLMRPERGGTEVRSEGVGGVGKAVGSRVGYLERRWFGRSAGRQVLRAERPRAPEVGRLRNVRRGGGGGRGGRG